MDDKAREELVERVAKVIDPDAFGVGSSGLAPEIWVRRRDFARHRARAALAVIEPVVREECAKVAEAHFQKAHGRVIAAAIRGDSNGE